MTDRPRRGRSVPARGPAAVEIAALPARLVLLVLFVVLIGGALVATPAAATKVIYVAQLYSWPDGEGSWFFTLIPNDAPRTDQEILDDQAHRVHGVEELGPKFRELHEFTHVFWVHRGHSAFTYPDHAVIERVWTLADRANVKLELPEELEPKE